MNRSRTRARPAWERIGWLAGVAWLLTLPATIRAQTCPFAYFEIPATAVANAGWAVPAPGGAWTEIWPAFAATHLEDHFLDFDGDGLIDKTDAIVEAGVPSPWNVATIGTMLHLTPVSVDDPPGAITPIGPPIVAWWNEFYFRCWVNENHRVIFADPHELIVLAPECCPTLSVFDHITGAMLGFGPVGAGDLLVAWGPTGMDHLWFRVDAVRCGLMVAPDLATPATRRSWGAVKQLYR